MAQNCDKICVYKLDLSVDMLSVMTTAEDCIGENGFDCRNYGVLDVDSETPMPAVSSCVMR